MPNVSDSSASPTEPVRNRLPVLRKFLFGMGDLSTSLTLVVQTFYQLYFLTDVARLEPAAAGIVLGITRLWDAINDPLIGLLSDRIRAPAGKRRILLMVGSVPLGVGFVLCWWVPPLASFGLAIYYAVAIILFDTFFTVVHVGFNALTPAMTHDYDERSSLNGYRMFFSLGGSLAALIYAALLAEVCADERQRFAILGVTLGALAMLPPWIVAAISRGVDSSEPSRLGWRTAVRMTLANRPFRMLLWIYLMSWTAASVIAAMLMYFANYYLRVPEQANYFVLAAQGTAVLSIPLVVWATSKWDKPIAFVVGISSWCIVLVAFFAVPRAGVTAAYWCAILCGPGIATAAVIPWSMLPDLIEVEEAETGERREGAYYAFASFFQKLGTGLALWSIGLALSASGYVVPSDAIPVPEQPASTLTTIRWIIGPGTILLLLASIPFAIWYPLNRASHQQVLERLARRPSPDSEM